MNAEMEEKKRKVLESELVECLDQAMWEICGQTDCKHPPHKRGWDALAASSLPSAPVKAEDVDWSNDEKVVRVALGDAVSFAYGAVRLKSVTHYEDVTCESEFHIGLDWPEARKYSRVQAFERLHNPTYKQPTPEPDFDAWALQYAVPDTHRESARAAWNAATAAMRGKG